MPFSPGLDIRRLVPEEHAYRSSSATMELCTLSGGISLSALPYCFSWSPARARTARPAVATGIRSAWTSSRSRASSIPTTADYLIDKLNAAESDDVQAAVVQLDTPGGLDISMREIIQEILDSEVPVVVWIAPSGARAASAGTFITMAGHLAYMAEATEIGAATPINLGGDDLEGTLEEKVTNDAVAFIRELAIERGRNADWAEDAVREAASIGATEAEDIGVVDGVVSSLDGLLETIDGRNGRGVRRKRSDDRNLGRRRGGAVGNRPFSGHEPAAKTSPHGDKSGARVLPSFVRSLRDHLRAVQPRDRSGQAFSGQSPLFLSFYALSVLPTNWVGVALIGLAVVFFLMDLQTAGLGVWTIGGAIALIVGGVLLFGGASPELQLSGWAIAAAVLVTLIFFMSVMTAALRVRLRRPITGEEGIVGTVGVAKTDIAPEGTVLTKGTLWRARTMETGIAEGSKVEVKATEGLVLLVEPLHDEEHPGAEDVEPSPDGAKA